MNQWQPIETAPKDGTRVLLFYSQRWYIVVGCWDDDCGAKKPRPFWTNDLSTQFGRHYTRLKQPTHWMPLPEGPTT